MGRGRKKQYIKKLTTKDSRMLQAFRSVGYMNEKHLKDDLSQADKRIKNFERDGYIEKCSVYRHDKRSMESVYRLTGKGKELASTQLNLKNFYRSCSSRHDLAVADRYFRASEEQRSNWLTERDWKDRMQEHIQSLYEAREIARASQLQERLEERSMSYPDGGYVSETGQVIAIEVITKNYSEAEIEAKEEFVQELKADYQSVRI
ncbi:hypothetical protein NYE71_32815 [Bacillus sp. FSL K6-0273]|nr:MULTISPECIES: hypothetical protein [Bacillus cereus group]MEB9535874.1 hypothetical protein [Bacillus cereus]MBG9702281.1 hypothetical protein [Bacillus thuringiensis]MCU5415239.1 hypothetical protein [Bacillus wiedmannii]MDG1651674.1 hypothetical protein [Bacillus pacificus]MEB9726207.1 hypothetical protein [Bacillus cereus]